MKCFYHSADLDGHCSGAIVKYKFPECELIGINYGDPFPWNSIELHETVYMVDFSLQPFTEMVELAVYADLTWIDHHESARIEFQKSAEDDFPAIQAIVDTSKAACVLTWEQLFPQRDVPIAVQMLGAYDIWQHNENDLAFQYGMRLENTWPDNQALWKFLLHPGIPTTRPMQGNTFLGEIMERGRIVVAYEALQSEKYAKAFAFECKIDGVKAIAVNRGMTNSLMFDSIYDPEKHDILITFAYRKDKWAVSLYTSKEEIDVSEIAKRRGGGGHKQAAGYQTEYTPFANYQMQDLVLFLDRPL